MKYCERPFKRVYVFPNGDVKPCDWSTRVIGNLLKQDLEEIWHSDAAEQVRDSVRNNTFQYCPARGCPFCENDNLENFDDETEKEKFEELCTPTEVPIQFNCAIDHTCNHACPSCRSEVFIPSETYKQSVDTIIDKLLPYLANAEYIVTDGQGDCFASPRIMRMLEQLRPNNPEMNLTLETNGVLFDKAHWERISHLSSCHIRVVVTPNSFERSTFKYLSGGFDDLDKLIDNLRFIRHLRENEAINDFAVSIVVQDSNFRELPAFAQRCLEEFCVDSVTVKPIYRWFKLSESEYLMKDVLNPLHPYFEEYQEIWKDPRLQDERLFWWGAKNIHPAVSMRKFENMWNTAADWLECIIDNPDCVSQYLKSQGYGKVAIYGYGRQGKMLYRCIKDMTNLIIDAKAKCVDDNVQMVLESEERYPDTDLIIVTPHYEFDGICQSISGKTSAEIISLRELFHRIKRKCR